MTVPPKALLGPLAALVLALAAFLPSQAATAATMSDAHRTAPPVCTREGEMIADPDDPHWLYHCSNGVAYHKLCPAGLHFNPFLETCDWPEHANNPAATTGSGQPAG
ncbi:carbohydrate-binding module family 14 protein [Streptomyces lunalinharesii]|uniref:Chitin-binding type-2 domain-containing protein n=1 Tax=Streptomyces lunalinharesii TaxID=333384 RepID=A0ABN3T8J2_9ACTN